MCAESTVSVDFLCKLVRYLLLFPVPCNCNCIAHARLHPAAEHAPRGIGRCPVTDFLHEPGPA